MTATFVPAWREQRCKAYDLHANSTARRSVPVDFWGTTRSVYANANLSIYSAAKCNARCGFCVEELRPASRGLALAQQKRIEPDNQRYFASLEAVLQAVAPLNPSVSITGGEPSLDPRLPAILDRVRGARRLTMTTNGSGLVRPATGQALLAQLLAAGLCHLNISRAHRDEDRNRALMHLDDAPDATQLRAIAQVCRKSGARLRLSCALLRGEVDDLGGVLDYLDFAQSLGIDNIIFRQLMGTDARTHRQGPVVRYSDERRVELAPIWQSVSNHPEFTFVRQVVGYYYYVEVWRWRGMDVVFEEADLARLEDTKQLWPNLVHELVFHPSGRLCSTWQPWDGVLGPPTTGHFDLAALPEGAV